MNRIMIKSKINGERRALWRSACTFRLGKFHKSRALLTSANICGRRLEFAFSHSSYIDRGSGMTPLRDSQIPLQAEPELDSGAHNFSAPDSNTWSFPFEAWVIRTDQNPLVVAVMWALCDWLNMQLIMCESEEQNKSQRQISSYHVDLRHQ